LINHAIPNSDFRDFYTITLARRTRTIRRVVNAFLLFIDTILISSYTLPQFDIMICR